MTGAAKDQPFPECVYDMTRKFAIDDEVRSLASRGTPPQLLDDLVPPYEQAGRFHGEYYAGADAPEIPAVMIARRTLEAAHINAELAVDEVPGRWQSVHEHAKHVRQGISKLLLVMEPDVGVCSEASNSGADAALCLATLWSYTNENGLPIHPRPWRGYSRFENDVLRLRSALDLVAEIENRTNQVLSEPLPKSVGRPGNSQLHAFAEIMAKGWLHLTGHVPSLQKDRASSPFLRFVDAGWKDSGNQERSFAAYVKSAREKAREGAEFL